MNGIIFHEGETQHFIREEGEPESRLVYRGDLVAVRR